MEHPDELHDDDATAAGLHADVLRWVSRELDGELPQRERILLADHLDGCPRCAAVARDLRGIERVARDDVAAAGPVGLVERVMGRLRDAEASEGRAPEPAVVLAAEPRYPEIAPIRALRRSAALAAGLLAMAAGAALLARPDRVFATPRPSALESTDPALRRVLERWQKGRAAAPSFFEMVLPAADERAGGHGKGG